jgi:hypothetical protein
MRLLNNCVHLLISWQLYLKASYGSEKFEIIYSPILSTVNNQHEKMTNQMLLAAYLFIFVTLASCFRMLF